jgi:hypothetical protein
MSEYRNDINDQNLPSIDDLIGSGKNLETVDNLLENLKEKNLESIDDYFCEEEVILEEDIDENLPSIDDYIEEIIEEEAIEEEVLEEDPIEDLKVLIEEVRNSIPEIPEFKSYDEEILQLLNLIESVQNQIPEPVEVPEVKYYDEDINLLTERIDYIRQTIINLPEVRYYEEEIQLIESEVSNLQEKVDELPEVKYYDEDISRLDCKIDDTVDLVDKKINDLSENIDVKFFESKVDSDSNINDRITNLKNSLKKDIDLYEVKILDLKNINKQDVKSLKKELKELSKNLDKDFDKKIGDLKKEYTSFDTKFGKYSEEIEKLNSTISNFPKVKYYDEDIKKIQKNVSSIEDSFKIELKELQSIVENIKSEQIDLKEGLLNEPPEIENKDPLTPTDQKFATLEDLSNHYRLFINRVQQQLSTLGGGGETRLEFLDDVDRDTAKVDGKFLKYDAASGKWVGAIGGGGGSQTLNDTLGLGNTSSLGMSVGLSTATRLIIDPIGSGTTFTEDLVVKGNARVTGILSIGTGTITLDPNDNAIVLADVKIRRDHSTGDIRFLDIGGNLSNIIANTVVVGSGTSAVNISNVNGSVVFTDTNNTIIHSVDRTNVSYAGNVSYTGVVTASSFVGDGSLLTGVKLSTITDIDTSNLSGISTDYIMIYDPKILRFKFVDPKTYFGINNDYNPSPEIVDYGSY